MPCDPTKLCRREALLRGRVRREMEECPDGLPDRQRVVFTLREVEAVRRVAREAPEDPERLEALARRVLSDAKDPE